jgi:methyl-accepting chemotaxis protein
MAGDSRLSARFGADTSDLKSGLADINRALKVTESAFQASASTLGDWSDTSDGLTLRMNALSDKIELQKDKVAILRGEYERIVEAQGKDSAAAQNAEIAYNKSVETLGKMQVELKDTTGALQKMGQEVGETGNKVKESGSKFKGFGDIVKDVKDIIKNAGIIMAGVAVALKKAWDFAEQGAEIAQINDSYNSLIQRLGESSDALDRLSAAARGTIDGEDLMAASMQMLTGTSEKLSKSLLENAPALMEIAKASNKLNPTMGSTLELFDSISTSIKNLTPRGLKQAGLVIDSTAAYEDYAKHIRKTADALTEEEKSMALLNAVLEKGQTILAQVGGNTESATDRFERANVAIGELKDNIALKLLPVMGDLATALNLVLTSGQGGDLEGTTSAWKNFFYQTSKSGKGALDFATAYGQQAQITYDTIEKQGSVLEKAAAGWAILLRGQEGVIRQDQEAKQVILQLATSYDEYIQAAEKAGLTSRIVKKEDQLLTEAEFQQYKQLQELAKAVDITSLSYDEFLNVLERATGINFDVYDSTNFVDTAVREMAANLYNATHATQQHTDAANDGARAIRTQGDAIQYMQQQVEKQNLKTWTADMKAAAKAAEFLASFAINGALKQAVKDYDEGTEDLVKKRQELEKKMRKLGATDFLPALDVKKIGQYQSQLTGLWISIDDLIKKRKENADFSDEEQATWDATMNKIGALQYKIKELGGVPYLTPDQREELEQLRQEYQDTGGDAQDLKNKLADATREIIFQKAAAGLDAIAMLELGKALGILSEEDYAVGTKLAELKAQLDDKKIDSQEYAEAVSKLVDAVNNLHDKNVTITVTTLNQEINQRGSGSGAPYVPGGPSDYGYAQGGIGKVPPGYPNDSYPVWMTSGEEFVVTPAGSPGIARALAEAQQAINAAVAGMNMTATSSGAGVGGAGAAGGTNITIAPGAIQVYGAPGMDEDMLAQKVIDRVGSVLDNARSKGLR